MSPEKAEGFRRAVDAWNTGDVDLWAHHLPKDFEWHDAPDVPDRRVHRGREAVVAYLRELVEVIGQFEIDLDDVTEVGEDEVVATFRINVHGRQSGVTLQIPWVHVMEFRGGRPVCVRNFQERAQALKAVGLRE